jgi:hypothetical protein
MVAQMTVSDPQEDTDRPVPVVDFDRIEETYAELKKMEVVLDPNPIEYGPKRFSNRIAKVRAMLNRVEQIFLQTSEDLHYFQRIINSMRTLYELEKRELMVNDPRCRVGRSQQEREALADVQLRDQIEAVQKLELAAHDLETMMISIKSKRTDLKDVQGRMRDQMKLIEHDLGMGARWGSNAAPSSASQSVREIDDMLATVDQGFGIVAESEDDEDEQEEIVVDDARHDPSPQAPEPEPVLVFGEETPAEDDVTDEATDESVDAEALIPDENSEGELPEDDQAQDEADSFLDALSMGTSDEPAKNAASEAEGDDDSGIDSLIASLADD